MVLAPVVDMMDVLLAFVLAAEFILLAILFLPIIILLEATLLRRLIPGTSAVRNSLILNISTGVLGALFALVLSAPLSFLDDSLEEGELLLVLFLITLALTLLIEGGVLKLLETKISISHCMRTSTIINLASYAALGLAVGLVFWGYDSADRRGDAGFLLCLVPIAGAAAIVILIFENFLSSSLPRKSKVLKQETATREKATVFPETATKLSDTNPVIEDIEVPMTPEEVEETLPSPVESKQAPMKDLTSWILVTTVGTTLAFGLSAIAIYKLKTMGGILWSILLLGIVIGGMQWLLLRKHVQKAGWWILATLGGWAVTLLVAARASVLLEITPEEFITNENNAGIALGIFVAGLLLGIVTGVLQWLVIRTVHDKSPLWIMFSSVGWIVGLFTGSVVGLSVYDVLQQYSSLFGARLDINPHTLIRWPVILAGIATGVTAGAITGTAFARGVQLSKSKEALG
jgi:hypothetical protein